MSSRFFLFLWALWATVFTAIYITLRLGMGKPIHLSSIVIGIGGFSLL